MAVTKIWKINGWIGDCLLYIENPNKTQNPLVIGDPKLKEEEYQSSVCKSSSSSRRSNPKSTKHMK